MTVNPYTTKAEAYARYRWEYAPEAVLALFQISGIDSAACVIDAGAGTAILTRRLAERIRQVYAIEPDPGMRSVARKELATFSHCHILAGPAEQLPFAANEVDLICAAQAAHWFQLKPARAEFSSH